MAGRKDVHVSKGHRRQGNDAPCCVFQTVPAGLDDVNFTYESRRVSAWLDGTFEGMGVPLRGQAP